MGMGDFFVWRPKRRMGPQRVEGGGAVVAGGSDEAVVNGHDGVTGRLETNDGHAAGVIRRDGVHGGGALFVGESRWFDDMRTSGPADGLLIGRACGTISIVVALCHRGM